MLQRGLRLKIRHSLIPVAAALALLVAACGGGDGEDAKAPIVFGAPNWQSAELQTWIAKYIVEHGYGYPTDVIPGGTILLLQGLSQADVHVMMEVWLPNATEAWEKALGEGTVAPAGESLRENWQGFVIPQYVKDQYPGLVSVTDLFDYIEVFATSDSRGKVRFLNCISGWACEEVNTQKIASYGLTDHVQSIDPGSQSALWADLAGSYARGEPWIGYAWSPTLVSARYDLYLLEEPPYSDECWETTKACAYETGTVLIGVHASLPDRAPDVMEFFDRWDYAVASQNELVLWLDENNAATEDGAIHFLRTQRDVWSAWVPDDVAERVDVALADEG